MNHPLLTACLSLTLLLPHAHAALPQDEDPVLRVENALLGFINSATPDSQTFLGTWIAPATRDAVDVETAHRTLDAIHATLHGGEVMDAMADGSGSLVVEFGSPGGQASWLHCVMQTETPYAILNLWIEGGPALVETEASRRHQPPVTSIPVSWDTLEDRLELGVAAGFEGSLLIVRRGETVLHEGYGLANRERKIPNRPDTIFATGSLPIDYTLAAVLLLQEEGKLNASDPISTYIADVPEDKQAITIEYLMTGASGLRNFHDKPTDRDPDHAWIDRDEALRRILSSELLFPPGTGREHSHSAWGVLAAIVEMVSGQSYQDFTRERIFEPLGMHSTGFNGDPLPVDRTAIGYGDLTDGITNAPPFWGKTSWLVLGSGGQVSTTGDMARFVNAVHGGELLNDANTGRFLRNGTGLLNGGDSYGFEVYYTYSRGSYMIMMANSSGPVRRAVGQLAKDLATMVLEDSATR